MAQYGRTSWAVASSLPWRLGGSAGAMSEARAVNRVLLAMHFRQVLLHHVRRGLEAWTLAVVRARERRKALLSLAAGSTSGAATDSPIKRALRVVCGWMPDLRTHTYMRRMLTGGSVRDLAPLLEGTGSTVTAPP